MKDYPISLEIAGPMALWTRPDSGAAFVSYPAPTFSAVRGILDCIARWTTAYLHPTRVEICRPLQTVRWVNNSRGPLVKPGTTNYQLFSTCLIDVCYRIHAEARESSRPRDRVNHLHALQELFYRRLAQGKLYRTPCLGWSEMTPSYLGEFRRETKVCEDINLTIPSMLHSVFDAPHAGRYAPRFVQDVHIEKGVLTYAQ